MHSYMLVDRWLHRDDSLPRHMRTVLLIGFDFSMVSKYLNLRTSSRHVSRRNDNRMQCKQQLAIIVTTFIFFLALNAITTV